MPSRTFHSLLALTTVLTTLSAPFAALAFDESKYPDWSGQWIKADPGAPRYDPSKPDGRGQQAPLKEPYRRMHEESMADQKTGGQGLYISSVKCIPMGMPFQMGIVFPFEFVVTEKTTFVLYEIMTSETRRIYTDGRDWPKEQDPTFPGYSIGRWLDTTGSGRYDTLEIETRDLRVPRLFDQTGISFSEDGQSIIKERIYLDKNDPKILHDEMTTIDNALTRPWSAFKSYKRMPKVTWTENNCTEGNYNIAIGDQVYLLSGDGKLMPIRKGQPAPDLSYFKQVPK